MCWNLPENHSSISSILDTPLFRFVPRLSSNLNPKNYQFPSIIGSFPKTPDWAGYLDPEAGRAPASLESNGASERTLAHPSKHREILTLRWPKGCHDLAGLKSQGIYLRNNNCDNLPEVGKLIVTNQNRWAPFERAIFEHDFQAYRNSGVRLSSPDVLDTTSLQQAFFGKMIHRNPMETIISFVSFPTKKQCSLYIIN